MFVWLNRLQLLLFLCIFLLLALCMAASTGATQPDVPVSHNEADVRQYDAEQLIQRERQNARAAAATGRQNLLARQKIVSDALKTASLPPVAALPPKAEWPMPAFIEDPAWHNSTIALMEQLFPEKEAFAQNYRLCLHDAIKGNPLAMLYLAEAYRRWGPDISGALTVLYPPMHSEIFWRTWAESMTSQTWVSLRLGDLADTAEEKKSLYTVAAATGNAEAMFKLSQLEDRPDMLIQAALGGHARAAAITAFNLLMGTDGFPANQRMAGSFWWRAALGGDAQAQLLCSEYFFRGLYGFPKDNRRACMFAMLALETARREDAVNMRNGDPARLSPAAGRHLESLKLAGRFTEDTLWQIEQDKEIFKAARAEESLLRLHRSQADRSRVLADMQDDLFMAELVLLSTDQMATEDDIIAAREKAMLGVEEENTTPAYSEARTRNNFYFAALGLSAIFLLPVMFLLLRSGLLRRIAKWVSG